jgi:RNA polymerase sigma-70 factor (ECF subfamily)
MYQRPGQMLDGSPIGDLYHKHAHDVLRDIHRYIFSKEEADDLLMEVFLAAIESPTLLKLNVGEQIAWLRRVAHNKVIDYQRRVVKRPVGALEEMLDSPFDMDYAAPEQVVVNQEELELCRVHLSALPELQQQVLLLRFGDDLRTKEIASKLHKSDGAVRSLLLRSLNLLRDFYHLREEGHASGQSR